MVPVIVVVEVPLPVVVTVVVFVVVMTCVTGAKPCTTSPVAVPVCVNVPVVV